MHRLNPKHIKLWHQASVDWHTTHAENDLQIGGKFMNRMAAKDGSFSFDFSGTYTNIELYKTISYRLEDDRMVDIEFKSEGNRTHIIETFEVEGENPLELQQTGWQAIMNSFKSYTEIL